METLRLARATHQLLERGVEALEKIERELERYNDRQEPKHQATDTPSNVERFDEFLEYLVTVGFADERHELR
ncbi:Uncharacterized protein HSBGL_4025 (plasmid) [Halapricum desulfuricans]|uniref:Uncharacterized protein n=1 Tax=Halapricum desulfuricans TaxID=2841257 RepID=A0A897NRH3_9EURY|nr:hypothetical protein [Halapricum desulfuricans]QSG13439.1 Uncharacterized protein HSBGL_4025 [Halapricum desulfuricans]